MESRGPEKSSVIGCYAGCISCNIHFICLRQAPVIHNFGPIITFQRLHVYILFTVRGIKCSVMHHHAYSLFTSVLCLPGHYL